MVHEWGTFTSVQSPLGTPYQRMYLEDEPLPAFVHRLDGKARFTPVKVRVPVRSKVPLDKFFLQDRDALSVYKPITQKLETPVLYFYGPPKQGVRATVKFPKGLLSEWYPGATTIEPEAIEQVQDGGATWEFDLLDRPAHVIPVMPDDIWAPAREVDALTVKVGEEEEPFIFYRGVGVFDMPVVTRSDAEGQVEIHNQGDHALPAVFLYRNVDGKKTLVELGALPAATRHVYDLRQPSPTDLHQMPQIKKAIAAALIDQGLYLKEAQAMLDTWERSYFETPGTRVLYLVPKPWTDDLLPLFISPQPDRIERVLIGRIDVTSPAQEDAFHHTMANYFRQHEEPDYTTLGRYALPKVQALHDRASNPEYKRWLAHQIEFLHRSTPTLKE